jgi:hypothetical protein
MGIRQDSEFPKKICIIDQKLSNLIVPNILYDVTLIPMKEKNGYIAIEATPVAFRVTIETSYVPKAIYKVEVKHLQRRRHFRVPRHSHGQLLGMEQH